MALKDKLTGIKEGFQDFRESPREAVEDFSYTRFGRFLLLFIQFSVMSTVGFFAGGIAVSRALKPAIQQCQAEVIQLRSGQVNPPVNPAVNPQLTPSSAPTP